ncbi:MAG: tRNA (adenosine(37)-N6)-dimethylallyltransferase MiaA [Elusimicrobia bacterium]|nr:tRNA (adenosine(37)-N6)-dimethylallyltransferase MiaA [Elusimicrobiota bacterium]
MAPEKKAKKKLIVIGGPTGIGKSFVAYNVALKIRGEIISADSMQFYREINIGTDKVPMEIREKIPHYLIDFLSLRDEFDVYQFVKQTTEKIDAIHKKGGIPIVVGGSGLYLRSLFTGIFYIPEDTKDTLKEIRDNLEKEKTDALYKKLKITDPDTAKNLHPNDKKRIRRALEVYLLTGKPMSLWQKEKISPISEEIETVYYILTRDRKEMYNRIERRVDKMFENGWVEEVMGLKEKGLTEYLQLKAPIGYKEILGYLNGEYDMDEVKDTIKQKTRNLAKRQLTWFRKESGKWIELEGEGENAVDVITETFKGGL